MRFTQFGHQVPRRNSTINAPRDRKPESERIPSRFAADSKNSGARDPTDRVSVRSDILISTLEHKRLPAACEKLEEPPEARARWMCGRLRVPRPHIEKPI